MQTASGQVTDLKITSKILPESSSVRPCSIYMPANNQKPVAIIYLLAAWTNAGRQMLGWQPFRETLPHKLDRLIASKALPPVAVVCPDLFTPYGGSQYIDSSFFGPHGSFFRDELIPQIENQLGLPSEPQRRAIAGISSGGYGALRLCLDFPGTFGSCGCISGDMGFEILYGHDLLKLASALAPFDYDIEAYLQDRFSADKLRGNDIHTLMLLGMCGFYSPNPHSRWGYDLPIDLYTGARLPETWQRWCNHDPITIAQSERGIYALNQLIYLHIECGSRDQYNLHFGARQLHQIMERQNIRHTFEEFPDNHSGLSYRFDKVLPLLVSNMP